MISVTSSDRVGMECAISIRDARSGRVLQADGADRPLSAASLGKLIPLAFVGEYLTRLPGDSAQTLLERHSTAAVSDSGIWQHLEAERLSLADAARLVFAVSDNLATNAIVEHFGLDEIRAIRPRLGFVDTDMFDIVRDERTESHPPTLAVATATELSAFMSAAFTGTLIDPTVSRWIVDGLSLTTDLSMVAGCTGLDPLAHPGPHHPDGVGSKTGADPGIRADAGLLTAGDMTIAYAVLCNFDPDVPVTTVLDTMREIGRSAVSRVA